MTGRPLIAVAFAAFLVFAAWFFHEGGLGSKPADDAAKSTAAPAAPATRVVSRPVPSMSPAVAVRLPELTEAQRHVTPGVLENLARGVALDGNEGDEAGNKKERWAKAMPVAQALVAHSDADCEQRNWLVRFVECGQQALSDSPDYYGSANELASMPRDRMEAQTGLPSN